MKNIILIIVTVTTSITALSYGQVAIGKSSVDGAGLLDFASGTTKGIVLPLVETLSNVEGSLIYDATVGENKVKYYNGTVWVDLSINSGTSDLTFQTPLTEEGSGAIIGADASSVDGILVLESTNKALILPKIASPHTSVVNPEPGMICYDTDSNMFAVYNGTQWAFWRTVD